MDEFYKIVWSEEELKNFYDKVLAKQPLLPNEVRYISLSVRNKYLTEEEREYYKCGRSEMFGKQVIRHDSYEAFLQAVYRYECNTKGYLTKSFVPYPQKAVVCYININPSDVLKTLSEMNIAIDENKDALVYAALKNSKDGISEAFHKIRKVEDTMISLYARNIGTKVWLDFDFDIDKKYSNRMAQIMEVFLNDMGFTDHYWVDTFGGLHLLFYKEQMKFNPSCLCTLGYITLRYIMKLAEDSDNALYNHTYTGHILEINQLAKDVEIMLNKNMMCPCPGTYQANYKVSILKPEMFDKISDMDKEHIDVLKKVFKEKYFVTQKEKDKDED